MIMSETERAIVDAYVAGEKLAYITFNFGISLNTLYRVLRKNNVPLRTGHAVANAVGNGIVAALESLQRDLNKPLLSHYIVQLVVEAEDMYDAMEVINEESWQVTVQNVVKVPDGYTASVGPAMVTLSDAR